jgi:hypothetical protein
MGLRGDSAKLRKIVKQVERLSETSKLKQLSDNLAEEAVDLVIECFRTETDPYGNKWPPKVFGDGRQVLVGKTANLRRSWGRRSAVKRSDGRGFRIASSMLYAKWMQKGTGIYGPRKQRIKPIRANFLAFFAEGYVTKRSYNSARQAWASSITSATTPAQARASFKKNVSGMKGSKMFLRSVKGAPQRKMVPDDGNLPASWSAAFVDTANDWFKANFEK